MAALSGGSPPAASEADACFFVPLAVPGGETLQIEAQWVGAQAAPGVPLIVFLHEGLGSVSMWRDFPARLCAAVGARGLVYSRPGYGRSTPRPPGQAWGVDFLHRQALELLPALLAALGIGPDACRPWLLGHSDGGSIALLYAAAFSDALAGAVVLAPHTHVEALSLASIAQARQAYLQGGLRQRLAAYHDDPDSDFWGWNDIWLAPGFRHWNIEADTARIRCPLLAVQGLDDPYGTLEQIRGLQRRAPHTRLLELPACGHSPHRDQPQVLTAAVQGFMAQGGAAARR
jgi:pimeloyl-ACP methyl ester carboxylesterase